MKDKKQRLIEWLKTGQITKFNRYRKWTKFKIIDLQWANLQWANLQKADLQKADLREANLDFSCLPLWCGSLNMKIDKRLACQFLYHVMNAMQSVDDEEIKAFLVNEDNKILANQFHRIGEYGAIK